MASERLMFMLFSCLVTIVCLFSTATTAYPYTPSRSPFRTRQYPQFPEQPPSCPICAQNYSSISHCAQAAPVLANFTMIIFNPGAFIDVIECACTDTFQSAYPQCVDCFEQTNQTSFLDANTQDLPGILKGLNSVCAIASTLVGNVSETDGETTPLSSVATATATASNTASTSNGNLLAALSPRVLLAGISLVLGLHLLQAEP
ncbi:hypothetical protein BC835DRAFT_98775 [Cytidiella melzeri]|nr:hypothetical protein BC835DRAFT_98775 [Cytidiella melzeri]